LRDMYPSYVPHCNTIQNNAIHGYILQDTATRCNALHRMRPCTRTPLLYGCVVRPLSLTTHCNTLQHPATQCNTVHNTATHCDTLQHTTIHRNTLQHTVKTLPMHFCVTLPLSPNTLPVLTYMQLYITTK